MYRHVKSSKARNHLQEKDNTQKERKIAPYDLKKPHYVHEEPTKKQAFNSKKIEEMKPNYTNVFSYLYVRVDNKLTIRKRKKANFIISIITIRKLSKKIYEKILSNFTEQCGFEEIINSFTIAA